MAKTKSKGTAAKVTVLSPEEFQKLTPEEQAKYLNDLAATNKELQSSNDSLAKDLAEAKAELEQEELPTFDVEEDKDNDIEGGKYQFTCPKFHYHGDNTIIDVRELAAAAEGDDKKEAEKAQAIIAELVKIKSGIVARKED